MIDLKILEKIITENIIDFHFEKEPTLEGHLSAIVEGDSTYHIHISLDEKDGLYIISIDCKLIDLSNDIEIYSEGSFYVADKVNQDRLLELKEMIINNYDVLSSKSKLLKESILEIFLNKWK